MFKKFTSAKTSWDLKIRNGWKELGEFFSRMVEKIDAVLEVKASHEDYKGWK